MQSKSLQKLGLSEKETKVYLAALELGSASALQIAKKTNIKRATVYVMLESLTQKGLTSTIIKGKKRLFTAESPETLLVKLQEKELAVKDQQKQIKELLPELKSIHNLSETKPRVRLYEGIEGLKTIYEDTLKEKKLIYAFTAVIPQVAPELSEWLEGYYVKKRKELKIFAKVITPETQVAQDYHEHDQENYRQSMLIPADKFPFSIEVNIYGNKVALVSYKKEELLGVIIESKEIAGTLKLIFDLSWERALEYQK